MPPARDVPARDAAELLVHEAEKVLFRLLVATAPPRKQSRHFVR